LREDFETWPGATSDVGFAHERSGNAATTQKTAQKNGRSEERPSSGRKRPERAAASQSKITIPRCNNMPKFMSRRKSKKLAPANKCPRKSKEIYRKNRMAGRPFSQ
jgi:hypothetical protein